MPIINGMGRWGVKAKTQVIIPGDDADAQAFITAAGITDTTQQSAINTLVTNLKSYGIWTKMKAIYPFVGGTANAHKFNLKNPVDSNAAFRLVFGGGWTHSSNGVLPNGTTAYADTFFNPVSQSSTLNSFFLSVYSKTNSNIGFPYDIGNADNWASGAKFTGIITRYAYGQRYISVGDNAYSTQNPETDSRAFYCGGTNGSSNQRLYKNGVSVLSGTSQQIGFSNCNIYISAVNTLSSIQGYSNKQLAFASLSDGLSETDAANFYRAVQIFQSTLGRHEGVPIVSDTDAQTFLNAAVITNTTQASAVNTLVTSLKSYGIWSKLKAIYPMVGGTAVAHKFNLKDPRDIDAAFRLGFYGGVTHTSNGILFNGTTGGAFTYFNAFVNQTKNNLHLSLYTRTRPTRAVNTNDINMLSGYGEIGWTVLRATSNSDKNEYFGTSDTVDGTVTLSNSTSVGFSLGSRTSSTSIKYYKNTTSVSGTGGVHNNDFKNAALTLNGNASGGYSAGQYAFASLGDGLTDAEAANYYTAVQAFQTTLGRQV